MKTWHDIPGWFDFERLYQAQVDRAKDGARFIEVGSWLGRSTAFLAERISQSGKEIAFYAVDHGLGSPSSDHEEFRTGLREGGGTTLGLLHRSLLDCGLADHVVILGTTSIRASELFGPESLDFVFIDGDHAREAVLSDLAAWWPKVKLGGLLAGHDYTYYPSVALAVHEFFGEGNRQSGDSPVCWEIRKGKSDVALARGSAP